MKTESRKPKILVIDDEADTRIFLCNLLGTCGYEALDAADAGQALAMARSRRPDLIILELTMPGEKGSLLYRSLQQDAALRSVPVILVSTLDSRSVAVYGKSHNLWPDSAHAPGGAFLEKPLEAEALIRTVRRLTRSAV